MIAKARQFGHEAMEMRFGERGQFGSLLGEAFGGEFALRQKALCRQDASSAAFDFIEQDLASGAGRFIDARAPVDAHDEVWTVPILLVGDLTRLQHREFDRFRDLGEIRRRQGAKKRKSLHPAIEFFATRPYPAPGVLAPAR